MLLLQVGIESGIQIITQTDNDVGVGHCAEYNFDSFSGQGRTQAWELLDLCIRRWLQFWLPVWEVGPNSDVYSSVRFQELRKTRLKGVAPARVHASNLNNRRRGNDPRQRSHMMHHTRVLGGINSYTIPNSFSSYSSLT